MNEFLQRDNVIDVIRQHGRERPLQDAVTLVPDPAKPQQTQSLSYQSLDHEARRIARGLQQRGQLGDRVLLLYSTGVDFAAAFIGCIYAGMVAVPAPLPGQHAHQQKRIQRIATDAGVIAILSDRKNLESVTTWAAQQELGRSIVLDLIEQAMAEDVNAGHTAWSPARQQGDQRRQ